ncbi:MAG: hypothetical protein D6679_09795 [Candidatus Hydrogenedentota bacterium]|nr:MAG: hypothetical protein D6679_09795 [Candidatus Hydrogenedentota bacterium]
MGARDSSEECCLTGPCPDARDHRIAGLLFAAFLLFEIAFAPGHLFSYDEVVILETAQQILDSAQAGLPDTREIREYSKVGRDGRLYSKFGMGMTGAVLPFAAAGRLLGLRLSPRLRREFSDFIASFANAFYLALLGSFLYLLMRDYRLSRRAGTAATVTAILGTSLCVFGRGLFNDLVTGLGLLLAFRSARTNRPFLAGSAVAISIASRLEYVLVLPAFFLFAGVRRRPARFLAPLVFTGGLLFLYNAARFGAFFDQGQINTDPYDTFSTPLLNGLTGLFLSPGKGVFWYTPPLLLAILAVGDFSRRYRTDLAVIVALSVPLVILHAKWHSWMGGWSFGPRRLIALLPLWLLPSGLAVEKLMRTRRGIGILGGIFCFGLAVQSSGLLVNFMRAIPTAPDFSSTLWTFRFSGAFHQWRYLFRTGDWDNWLYYLTSSVPAALGGVFVFLLASVLSFRAAFASAAAENGSIASSSS